MKTQEKVDDTIPFSANTEPVSQEIEQLQGEINNLHSKNQQLEHRLKKLRSSVTYQLGYAQISAVRSWKGLFSFPRAMWRISKKGIRHIRKHKYSVFTNFVTHHNEQNLNIRLQSRRTVPRVDLQSDLAPPIVDLFHLNNNRALKVACIMDEFTFSCFSPECELHQLTPDNWSHELKKCIPELLFIESAWRGKDDLWGNKVGHTSKEIKGIVAWCQEHNIPTVFWNKEDPVHYTTFLSTAQLFDHVFTTDIDSIHRYKADLGHNRVYLLPFACQPKIHNPIEKYQRKDAFCFAGAYYVRYPERTKDLENFISVLTEFMPFEIYDRNYGKEDPNYRFPDKYQHHIVGTLPIDHIDKAYKGYNYAINLNSIKNSQSMFARRIYELLGSGTITISNYSKGLRLMFGDLVLSSDSGAEILTLLKCLTNDHEKAGKFKLAGLRKVMHEHTYSQRLDFILSIISGMPDAFKSNLPSILVLSKVDNQEQADSVVMMYHAQTHKAKRLLIIAPSTVRIDPNMAQGVEVLQPTEGMNKKIHDVIRNSTWLAGIVPQDYYGPNYLLDMALATQYSPAEAIGKSAHYQMQAQNVTLLDIEDAYKPTEKLRLRCTLLKAHWVLDTNLIQWLEDLPFSHSDTDIPSFAIDPYNYCSHGANQQACNVSERVDDLSDLDLGLPLKEMQNIVLTTQVNLNKKDEKWLDSEQLAVLFANAKSRNINIKHQNSVLSITSRLQDGKHEYINSCRNLDPNLFADKNEVKCYFDSSPGLNISLVVLFLDAQNQRISNVILQCNSNASTPIPPETSWLRLGLRIYGSGQCYVKGIVAGHRSLNPSILIPRSQALLVTNNYPSYDDLYRNGFVHTRVKAYQKHRFNVDVFRLRQNMLLSYHEFQNVNVTTGSQESLRLLLEQGNYKTILVHFLDCYMWEVIKDFLDKIKVIVWVHGAEVQPWWRRDYNYDTEEQLQAAKIVSDKRLSFWRSVLPKQSTNLKFVFVSRYFADEVMEDTGIRISEENIEIIHNPIDTDIFSYQEKSSEQRKKILSIRSFASAKYANDLSVKAILDLSNKPFFNELEFRIIGDGKLFNETLSPLYKFENVIIERRFLDHFEIADLHKQYGIFLCPTRMDSQGVSKDEAMSSGLVPVTNAVAAIPEFVDEHCGILAPAEDSATLAYGIERLFNDPELFVSMSKSANKNVMNNRSIIHTINKEINLINSRNNPKENKIDTIIMDPEEPHLDRVLISYYKYYFEKYDSFSKVNICSISGDGEHIYKDGLLINSFKEKLLCSFKNTTGVYQTKITLPCAHNGNGVSVRLKLAQWESIDYLAIGYTLPDNSFRHIKVKNPIMEEWFQVDCSHNDIIFQIQNDWQLLPPETINDVRIYMKGRPSSECGLFYIQWVTSWLEENNTFHLSIKNRDVSFMDFSQSYFGPMSNHFKKIGPSLIHTIHEYWEKCLPLAIERADRYLHTGDLPLFLQDSLDWSPLLNKPTAINSANTYRYSWHALTPATIFLMHWTNTNNMSSLMAAREFVNTWLNDSFYQPDNDKKYTWYDHGTAERLITMSVLWAEGLEHDFDKRFMLRLLYAIYRHAQLLDTEAFYASHQHMRYHNHAWFQDIALMVASLAIPEFVRSRSWFSNALNRLHDQLKHLIVRDNEFSIFVENSIGYHQGILRILEFAENLSHLSSNHSNPLNITRELTRWTKYFKYPNGRSPSQGDTFRLPSPKQLKRTQSGKPYTEPHCTILSNAGYAIIKGNHNASPFMLCMLATSLCSTHKHEDNLAITLFFDGIEWLIDPSFYSHDYDKPIPAYLRSSLAHNNVAILGTEYSIDPHHASISGSSIDDRFEIFGNHTAFHGYEISRHITGELNQLNINGYDSIKFMEKSHAHTNAYLIFHLGENVKAHIYEGDNKVVLSHSSSQYVLSIFCHGFKAEIFTGFKEQRSINSIAGHGFMESVDTTTIAYHLRDLHNISWSISATDKNLKNN